MKTYRRRPIQVKAMQWNGDVVESRQRPPLPDELRGFSALRMIHVGSVTHGGPEEWLPGLPERERVRVIHRGDWIVLHADRHIDIMSDDEFKKMYAPDPTIHVNIPQSTFEDGFSAGLAAGRAGR